MRVSLSSTTLLSLLLLTGCLVGADPNGGSTDRRDGDEGEGDGAEGEGDVGEGEGEGEGEGGEGEGEPIDGPDLAIDALPASISFAATYADFADDACEVTNALVQASGARALLQVAIDVTNVGTEDVDATTEAAVCTGVTVAPDFIEWRLSDADGVVASGRLNGPADAIAPNATVSVRADEQNLIDVTDLPAGDYVLELEVDPDGAFDDNAANNVASVRIPLVDMQCGGVVCGGVCCPADACEDDGVCHLPDLSVDTEVLEATEDITEHFVGTESCEMIEGCVGGTGNRRLLRFSTTTPNTGTEDLVMGRPEQNPQLFSYSDCHEHYHFDQYADYRLLAEDGTVAATGHKQAFCLIDLERRDDDANLFGTYDCRDQGISKGWADTYSSELDCQWIDITGVAAGNYVLEVHVNPQRIFPEMDHTNNIARVPVSITDDPNFCAPSDEICGNGEDEDCDGEADNGCAPITDNDTCGNAPNAEGSALYTGAITAANDGNVTPSCGGAGGDLFFEFNVPSPEILYLSTYGSEIDTTLSIFRNNACLPEDETDCVDDGCGASGAGGGHIVRSFESGPYTAVVKAKNAGDTGVVRLKIQQAGCNGALPLDGQVEGSTSDSVDNTAPVCAQPHQNGSPAGDGPDEQWYFTTCPGEHPATISTCDGVTQFDSLVELREGSCLGAPLDCNDDLPDGQGGCSTIEPSLRADGAGDGLWFVVVDGYGQNSEGPYSLSLDLQ